MEANFEEMYRQYNRSSNSSSRKGSISFSYNSELGRIQKELEITVKLFSKTEFGSSEVVHNNLSRYWENALMENLFEDPGAILTKEVTKQFLYRYLYNKKINQLNQTYPIDEFSEIPKAGRHSSITEYTINLSQLNAENQIIKVPHKLWYFEYRQKLSHNYHFHCALAKIKSYYHHNFKETNDQLFKLGLDNQSQLLCFKGLIKEESDKEIIEESFE
mmetsp:Transcript_10889/g.9607  ORF Transcript_10889/g.9607 Transcript_10889/m.9607 type:complete len:217 (-) Transcript_10889:371-1021(-)